jgi:hypothetical protein
MINPKLFEEFIKWGDGFTLEAERDYEAIGRPFVYHLRIYGLWIGDNEFVSKNINTVMKQAIRFVIENYEKKFKK